MTVINRTALVPYAASSLYELVLDVKKYPEFLPWCAAATVLEQSDEHQLASIRIAKGILKMEFTTRNMLFAPDRIEMSLVEGPFRALAGQWRFHDLAQDACKIEMDMDFQFAVGPADKLMTPVFSQICASLLQGFLERAKLVCGQT